MNTLSHDVLVLGIGNLLWADEGFGVRCVEAFDSAFDAPDNVLVMDGGTQGLYLLPYVEAAKKLVVFDAIDFGFQPGTLKQLEGRDVPAFMGAKKMSLHQTGFQEVLATADLFGDLPQRILLVGVQPEQLEDYGGSLRPSVKSQIPASIEAAIAWLGQLGIETTRRSLPLGESTTLSSPEVALAFYEDGRPTETQAYRHGDARVVFGGGDGAGEGAG